MQPEHDQPADKRNVGKEFGQLPDQESTLLGRMDIYWKFFVTDAHRNVSMPQSLKKGQGQFGRAPISGQREAGHLLPSR